MLDKKDTTLIKLDCKSKDKVYDMLFGKADACLKNAKTVALLYLGSPYYMTRALEEYNIEEINIFTTKDFKFIYEPFENAERVKIWYVDNVKDTFKECDMKFDCIIMNPPYNRGLHLKILAEAITHLKDEKSTCVNLSPVLKLQTAWRRGKVAKELSFLNSCTASVDVIDCDTAVALFNLGNCGTDLGIWKCALKNSTNIFELGKSITSNAAFIDKIKRITSNMPKMNEHLIDAMSVKNNSLFIKFVDGLSLKNHGGHGKSSYAATSINFSTATKFTPGHHCKYVLFTDKNEQFVFWKIYTSNVIRFFYMTLMGGNTEYELLPWLGDSINPRTGKKGYEGEWTDEDLYKFFNITPEEQKIIEETMAKYK